MQYNFFLITCIYFCLAFAPQASHQRRTGYIPAVAQPDDCYDLTNCNGQQDQNGPNYLIPDENDQYGPVPTPDNDQYGPVPTPNDQYGPIPTPDNDQYGPIPTPDNDQYGPVPTPDNDQYGPIPTPNDQYGPIPTPNDQYGPVPTPDNDQYGPIPTPNDQYGPVPTPFDQSDDDDHKKSSDDDDHKNPKPSDDDDHKNPSDDDDHKNPKPSDDDDHKKSSDDDDHKNPKPSDDDDHKKSSDDDDHKNPKPSDDDDHKKSSDDDDHKSPKKTSDNKDHKSPKRFSDKANHYLISENEDDSSVEIRNVEIAINDHADSINAEIENNLQTNEASTTTSKTSLTANVISVEITVTLGSTSTEQTLTKICDTWRSALTGSSGLEFDDCIWTRSTKRQAGSVFTGTTTTHESYTSGSSHLMIPFLSGIVVVIGLLLREVI